MYLYLDPRKSLGRSEQHRKGDGNVSVESYASVVFFLCTLSNCPIPVRRQRIVCTIE